MKESRRTSIVDLTSTRKLSSAFRDKGVFQKSRAVLDPLTNQMLKWDALIVALLMVSGLEV
jgi:hypothetical protein